jgi:luciferase family oxidoreductase group 1
MPDLSAVTPHQSAAAPRAGARLSVLDTAMIGRTAERALADTVALAQEVERLGFQRYWMAEHHGSTGVGSTAPAITIGAIAAATSRIRVGSGGVMVPNHIPLVVAEQFGTLAALYPGRVDLGVGRASPEPRTVAVLSESLANYGVDDFADRVVQLLGFLTGEFPAPHRFEGVYVSPRAQEPPIVWILGSSPTGAALAAALGLPFAFAHHFGRGDAAQAFDHYRRNFRPSRALSEPYTLITLLTAVADTDEEAARIASSADLMFSRLGQVIPGCCRPWRRSMRTRGPRPSARSRNNVDVPRRSAALRRWPRSPARCSSAPAPTS